MTSDHNIPVGISLAGFILELMNLINNQHVEESFHLCLDEFSGDSLAVMLLFDIRLPELFITHRGKPFMPVLFRIVAPFPDGVDGWINKKLK